MEIVNDNSIIYYVGNNLPFSGTYKGLKGFKTFFEKLFRTRMLVVKCQRLTFFGYDIPNGGVTWEQGAMQGAQQDAVQGALQSAVKGAIKDALQGVRLCV